MEKATRGRKKGSKKVGTVITDPCMGNFFIRQDENNFELVEKIDDKEKILGYYGDLRWALKGFLNYGQYNRGDVAITEYMEEFQKQYEGIKELIKNL